MLFPDEIIKFKLPDAELIYYPAFFSLEKANILFQKLQSEIPWQQDKINVYGKEHFQPRLTALFGNEGKPYGYSNIIMHPHQWTPLLTHIKNEIEQVCNTHFTTVLLNNYRNGQDSMGWHADNEKELGRNPLIASVSFGAERNFQLKHNTIERAKQNINLQHGSLLIMQGAIQHFWKHQIPKTQRDIGPRINLTFRVIK
ncbi:MULTISPECIES: alpha-ketoglutarate-dependent dioxygenase AlkB [Flavobacterium]|uniref:Alpha-ketoglutarate-dependent dioxygenase AlkB n=1 Tax=Flavobacterium columnare TaxID=996 RepID=A0A437UEY7_9FLAO|nr:MULTISPECIES: alpha-ketoglutarate-dependent dioxygenase AlkB [Flavobacterium]QYS88629.1 alpha-ketoglutarate-dependent dioxygenase AlkB [Flavobacterium davisii]RVU92088.1 alpha-ketoglutarate-dependent dioxygenase AlkB [Flavobacterium columnare]